jgi:hypothetical protein
MQPLGERNGTGLGAGMQTHSGGRSDVRTKWHYAHGP